MGHTTHDLLVTAVGLALLVGCSREQAGDTSTVRSSAWQDETNASLCGVGLNGQPVYPLQDATATAVVLVFVRTDCPLSNRYAPEIQRLQSKFGPRGVPFWLVYPDADASPEEIREHLEAYQLTLHALRDPGHAFVRQSGVRVTPEVAVFSRAQLVYRGRIDDRALELGKERPVPTRHDLEEVLDSVIQGRVVTNVFTTAVGCYISGEP